MNAITLLERYTEDITHLDSDKELFTRCMYGLLEECGEVARPLKRYVYRNEPYETVDLMLEVGDVLFNLMRIAVRHGYTMNDVAKLTLDKYQRRNREKQGASSLSG